MSRVFNKFSSLILMAALAGVMVPQVALAGGKGGNKGGGSFSKSMKSSGGSQFRSQSISGPSKSFQKVQKFNSPSMKVNRSVLNSTKKLPNVMPGSPQFKLKPRSQHINTPLNQNLGKKIDPKVVKTSNHILDRGGKIPKFPVKVVDPVIKPFPGGKPPVVNPFPGGKPPVVNPFPGGKPPVVNPFPGGKPPVVNPFPGGKPPVIDPFPGGKPPVIDPGTGNGNPGGGNPGGGNTGGNCPPDNDHCHNKYPWPIFWPIAGNYGGNYGNNCYYSPGYCATPTVIVNEVPPVVVNEVSPTATDPAAVTGANSVDLVLEDVQYVEPATALVGPAYRVKFRNQGLAAAGGFRVAIVAALDGNANQQSPMAVVDVAGLASGEATEVTVRLPRTALQLTSADGQTKPFTELLVAADFDNLIVESDKANNVAMLNRSQLEVAAK